MNHSMQPREIGYPRFLCSHGYTVVILYRPMSELCWAFGDSHSRLALIARNDPNYPLFVPFVLLTEFVLIRRLVLAIY